MKIVPDIETLRVGDVIEVNIILRRLIYEKTGRYPEDKLTVVDVGRDKERRKSVEKIVREINEDGSLGKQIARAEWLEIDEVKPLRLRGAKPYLGTGVSLDWAEMRAFEAAWRTRAEDKTPQAAKGKPESKRSLRELEGLLEGLSPSEVKDILAKLEATLA